jgi:hypothetical protein
MTAELAEPTHGRTSWRSLPPLALVPLAGVVWWVVGFLPWILDGLGQDVVRAGSFGPLAVPLFTGNVSALVLGAGLGGVVAGLVVRLGAGSRAQCAGACAAGVGIVLFSSLTQSRIGVRGVGIDHRITTGLTVVVILTTLVGLGIGLLSLTGRVGLGLSVAVVAGAVPVWLMSALNAVGVGNGGQLQDAQNLTRWAGAVALAVALIIVGLQPAMRAVAWPGAVLLAWFIAPTITAAGYMEVFLRAGMGLQEMWGDHLSAAADVWRMAASPHARPLTPWIAAIIVATGVALWLARRHPSEPEQPAQ